MHAMVSNRIAAFVSSVPRVSVSSFIDALLFSTSTFLVTVFSNKMRRFLELCGYQTALPESDCGG